MKKISFLALGLALAIGAVAEAGSIPTDRVPLQTYAIKKVYCYLQPNGTQKGYIDPGDYVVVEQIRSDGWAYGSYPVGKTRIRRWFKADDLVNNVGFTNQERYSPKANTYTYRNPNHNQQFGSFNDNEPILVVSDYGQSRQFIYKVSSGGYKMAWVPYWDCWDERQAGKQQVNNNTINKNPIVQPVKREEQKTNQTPAQSSYGVWKATARYTANTYDNPNLSGARVGWVTSGSNLEVLGENSKSYYIRYWSDTGKPRERYVERNAVKGLNEENNINTEDQSIEDKVKNRIIYMKDNISGYKANTIYTGTSECRGFANNVYTYLFSGVSRLAGYSGKYRADSYKGSKVISSIPYFNKNDIAKVKNIFQNIKPGYFIQSERRSGVAHSAIVGYVTSEGVYVYDANASNTHNLIQFRLRTWQKIAESNKAITIYAPNNYRLK